MIKFLSGLLIGLLVAQASASGKCSGASGGGVGTTWCENGEVPSSFNKAEVRGNASVAAGRTPSGKYHVIQVDEDGYIIVRKNP